MVLSDRSPAIVIAYLMKSRGWRLAQAYQWVKERRPAVELTEGMHSFYGKYIPTFSWGIQLNDNFIGTTIVYELEIMNMLSQSYFWNYLECIEKDKYWYCCPWFDWIGCGNWKCILFLHVPSRWDICMFSISVSSLYKTPFVHFSFWLANLR